MEKRQSFHGSEDDEELPCHPAFNTANANSMEKASWTVMDQACEMIRQPFFVPALLLLIVTISIKRG